MAHPISILCIALLAIGALADPIPEPYDPNPQYQYDYSVSDPTTGDSKHQEETRNGDNVQGVYSLIEPDGTLRTVRYSSDPLTGFVAVVERQPGAAPPVPQPQPSYRSGVAQQSVVVPQSQQLLVHQPQQQVLVHQPQQQVVPLTRHYQPLSNYGLHHQIQPQALRIIRPQATLIPQSVIQESQPSLHSASNLYTTRTVFNSPYASYQH